MQYALLYHENSDEFAKRTDAAQSAEYWGAWTSYMAAMRAAGVMSSGNALQPPESGSFVSMRGGRREIQDGPYADSKEQLGGYVIIDVADVDTALEWASRAPSAAVSPVEVRPLLTR